MSVPARIQPDKVLIDRIAAEMGTDLLHYLNWMYPNVFAAMNSGCKISIRNHIRNDMASVIMCKTIEEYEAWIAARRKHRRIMGKLRKIKEEAGHP